MPWYLSSICVCWPLYWMLLPVADFCVCPLTLLPGLLLLRLAADVGVLFLLLCGLLPFAAPTEATPVLADQSRLRRFLL